MENELITFKRKQLYQCHIDSGDPESFAVGEILEQFDDFILLHKVSPQGQWNGFLLYPVSDLVAVEEGTQYLAAIERLLSLQHQDVLPLPKRMQTGLQTVLSYASEQHRVVALELCKSGQRDVVGYFRKQLHSYIQIEQIDPFGSPDGTVYIREDAITRIYVADSDTICYELLYESRKTND